MRHPESSWRAYLTDIRCRTSPPFFDLRGRFALWKKIAIPAALFVLFFPAITFQSRFDVAVNWSFREASPTAHTVTIQETTFTIPPGQSTRQVVRLKGGGRSALLYTIRDWGFFGQQLEVDGEKVPLERIRITNQAGSVRISGIGRPPSMDVEIEM